LREHETFLDTFRQLFRGVDHEGKGIISEAQFVELLKALGVCNTAREVTYFLQIIDPFNTQCITFSDVV
jgi:Ca2+-binding EF-hand superfamily protein